MAATVCQMMYRNLKGMLKRVPGYLSQYRVLDMADRALLAGRMLAQLGAEVIQVEPPNGSPARGEPPFDDLANPPRSLYWEAFAAGKRSVSLDLESEDGREIFRRLVRTANFLLESEIPGVMASKGLGYDELKRINPALIYVSITPFGSTGPKASWQESDLVLWASGGPLFPSRDARQPKPLRISVPQAWLHAAADAAGGALTALHARHKNQIGQHVDISVQQSVMQATLGTVLAHAIGHEDFNFLSASAEKPGKKTLDLSGSGARTRQSKWEVADGLVEMHLAMGPASGTKTNNLFAWMWDEAVLPERMRDWDWISIHKRIEDGSISDEDMAEVRAITAAFLKTKRKAEIVEAAIERKILLAPICTVADLLESPHHAARNYFQTVMQGTRNYRLPGDFALGMPGGFARLTPAPACGQDNAAVLGALPVAAPMPAPRVQTIAVPPFAGLKVLDLAWVVAGPAIGRVLADFGAEVVRVESSRRVETARITGPFRDGKFDPQRCALYDTYNTGKLGLTLDLSQEDGRDVVRDLVDWADIVIESFTPGQMQRWGLGYPALSARKPGIIFLSTSLMGQTGPYANLAGYGNIGAAMSGYQNIVGWPGSLPIGPFGPYTDYVGPRMAYAALLAAMGRHRQTGEGCWIDVSQAEAGIQFLAPQIADCAASGRVISAAGNRDFWMVPNDVFPCAGEDRWVAITVCTDTQWQKLAALIGPAAADTGFATLDGRRAAEDRLETIIGNWTQLLPASSVVATLQAAGIPAHLAASSADILDDPQLAARGHFVRLPHDLGGESVVESSRFALSLTKAEYLRAAPAFGRDNDFVLRQLLGYGEEKINALAQKNVLV